MADVKKYYWLKLHKDFFKRHDIRVVEAMDNGKDYILFYMKLLLESVDHEGYLRFSDTIPYNEKTLSIITNTNIDIVRGAIDIFRKLDLMEILDDETIFLTQTQLMLGVETEWAKKKREYRAKQNILEVDTERTKKDNVRQEIEKEIDIEIDIEIEKEKDIKSKKEIGTNQEQMFPRDKILDLKEEEYISKSNKEEKNTKKKTATKRQPNGNPIDVEPELVYFTDLDLNETFIAFLEMRKKLKAINSDLAIKKLLNILNPFNDIDKLLMINNSIVNSWKGLFPIKHGNSKQSQKEQVMNDIDAALRQMKGR